MTQGQAREQHPVVNLPFTYRLESDDERLTVYIDDEPVELEIMHNTSSHGWCRWQNELLPYAIAREGSILHLWLNGTVFIFNRVEQRASVRRTASGSIAPSSELLAGSLFSVAEDDHKIVSKMAGRVLSVRVKAGDELSAGDEVCVLEAMKMEHSIHANMDGVVKAVYVEANQQVSAGDLLVELED